MAKAFLDRAVVTTSSESSDEEVRSKVRKMNLYQMTCANFLVYCDEVSYRGEKVDEEEKGEDKEEVFEEELDGNGNKDGGNAEEEWEKGGEGLDEDHVGKEEDKGQKDDGK